MYLQCTTDAVPSSQCSDCTLCKTPESDSAPSGGRTRFLCGMLNGSLGSLESLYFLHDGCKCRLQLTDDSVVVEYNTYQPRENISLPLERLIAVSPCYCKNVKLKRTFCRCVARQATLANSFHLKLALIRLLHVTYNSKTSRFKVRCVSLKPFCAPDVDVKIWELIDSVRLKLRAFQRPQRLLVVINPNSGNRKSPDIYHKMISPLFLAAGIVPDILVTNHANHALWLLEDVTFNVEQFDAVVGVGGDGIFHEIVNGLVTRAQIFSSVDVESPTALLQRPKVAVGLIPAGSTNAFTVATTGSDDPITAAVHIVLGRKIEADVCGVYNHQNGKLVKFFTISCCYGFLGDVIRLSERQRWMGPVRYLFAGLRALGKMRHYEGELRFWETKNFGSAMSDVPCHANCQLCAKAQGVDVNHNENNCLEDVYHKRIDKFYALNAMKLSGRSHLSKNGLAPAAHLGNGCLDLVAVGKSNRINFCRFLSRVRSGGDHLNVSKVSVRRVTEFVFIPKENNRKPSSWNCDGELLDSTPVLVKVHPQLITILAPGIDYYKKWTKKV